jgi:hypothetical protein
VLSLNAETDAVIGLFGRCYERRPNGFDAPTWQLVALPDPGAMSEQDAWTMEALGWVRDVRNRLEQDLMNAPKAAAAAGETVDD